VTLNVKHSLEKLNENVGGRKWICSYDNVGGACQSNACRDSVCNRDEHTTCSSVLPLCVTAYAIFVSKELQRARRRSFELCVMVAKKRKRRRILDHYNLYRYEYLSSEAVGHQLRPSHFLLSNAWQLPPFSERQ
jgi:hypothetical protein